MDSNSSSEINEIKEEKSIDKFTKIEKKLQEMKTEIQNEINNFEDYEDIISQLEDEVKNMKENSGEKLIQNSINSSINIINSHNYYINGSREQNHQDEKEEDDKDEFSFECTNIKDLYSEIYEGKNQTIIKITLKNNGKSTWPEDNTKLVFDKDSKFIYNDIQLQPQKSEEERSYNIVLSELRDVKEGKYDFYLLFLINGNPYGNRLTLSILIKSKDNEKLIIKQFRENFNLSQDRCQDEIILEQLKKHNYHENSAYVEIVNIIN
jgi:hypothetical protein